MKGCGPTIVACDEIPWLDQPEYPERVTEKLKKAEISGAEAEICRTFAEEGYFIMEQLISENELDRAWNRYQEFYQSHKDDFFGSPIQGDPWPERYLNTHNCVPENPTSRRSHFRSSHNPVSNHNFP